jgi:ferredoxin
VKMCTGCSLCWDFCPRGGLRYEALGEVMAGLPTDEEWKINGGVAASLTPLPATRSAGTRPVEDRRGGMAAKGDRAGRWVTGQRGELTELAELPGN